MSLYIVIDINQSLGPKIRSEFDENNRYEVISGTWFIRSSLITSAQVRDLLGIRVGGPTGIVVVVGRYTGVANTDFVEKLKAWDEAV